MLRNLPKGKKNTLRTKTPTRLSTKQLQLCGRMNGSAVGKRAATDSSAQGSEPAERHIRYAKGEKPGPRGTVPTVHLTLHINHLGESNAERKMNQSPHVAGFTMGGFYGVYVVTHISYLSLRVHRTKTMVGWLCV